VEEAESENVQLSEVERKMLYFTEAYPSLPDIYDVNAEFERTFNSDEYEAKVARLLKNARDRDSHLSPSREQEWRDALDAPRKQDHYILVMVGKAFGFSPGPASGHRVRDFLIYVAIGIAVVVFLILTAFWKSRH
jgi:hypothetical protein